jgi:hypothetical protein
MRWPTSLDELITLLTDDVLLTMPRTPLEYTGREQVAKFLTAVVFEPGLSFRMIPVRANGQPALGVYTRELSAARFQPTGVLVFTLPEGKVSGKRVRLRRLGPVESCPDGAGAGAAAAHRSSRPVLCWHAVRDDGTALADR